MHTIVDSGIEANQGNVRRAELSNEIERLKSRAATRPNQTGCIELHFIATRAPPVADSHPQNTINVTSAHTKSSEAGMVVFAPPCFIAGVKHVRERREPPTVVDGDASGSAMH
jgi:hypothetical protein